MPDAPTTPLGSLGEARAMKMGHTGTRISQQGNMLMPNVNEGEHRQLAFGPSS